MSQTLTCVSRGISSSDDDKDGRVNDDDETSVEESGLDGRRSTADGHHTLAAAAEGICGSARDQWRDCKQMDTAVVDLATRLFSPQIQVSLF